MAAYDFQCLSPREFEKLSRALLQRHLSINFEIFKEGKDQGIDLLFRSKKKSNDVVVQCKRYAPNSLSILKRDLVKEAVKIGRIKPKRYILFTSVKLSLKNKEDLLEVLFPYCQLTSDIYGLDDINSLLDSYPDVESSNFKLWLTSVPVLQKILHANIANFSDYGLEHIKRHYSKFVSNASQPRAMEILKKHHYCIIAGKPGIGKTTLAHVLLSEFISNGYEMVSITQDIEEAWTSYRDGKNKIFYYDDFLGQTSLQDKLEKNEDDRLIQFISMISSAKQSYFILTTREYILNQAALVYEKIARKAKGLEKCVIALEDYTKLNKAEILYNHIYFSDLAYARKIMLLDSSLYTQILNHKNYYPRLIEDITDRDVLKDFDDKDFSKEVMGYFDNPAEIWSRAFKAMSNKAQVLLLILTTLPQVSLYSDLEEAFNNSYKYFCDQKNWQQSLSDYRDALYELDGSPVKITKVRLTPLRNIQPSSLDCFVVEFENPSIRDYLENYLLANGEIARDLFNSSVFFDQNNYLLSLSIGQQRKNIRHHFLPLGKNVFIYSYRLMNRSASKIGIFQYSGSATTGHYITDPWCSAEKMSRLISKVSDKDFPDIDAFTINSCLDDFCLNIKNLNTSVDGLISLGNTIDSIKAKLNKADQYLSLITSMIQSDADNFESFYRGSDYLFNDVNYEKMAERVYAAAEAEVKDALRDGDAEADKLNDLKAQLSSFSDYGVDLSDLEKQLDKEIESIIDRQDPNDYEDERIGSGFKYEESRGVGYDWRGTIDREIDDMFSELKNSLEQ